MRTIALIIIFLLLPATVLADSFQYSWEPPEVDATHSPAVSYAVQTSSDGVAYITVAVVAEPTYRVNVDEGETLYMRVAGICAQGFQGPWSLPSDSLNFTPPGQPGKPSWVKIALAAFGILALLFFGFRKPKED